MRNTFSTFALVGFVALSSAVANAATDHSKKDVRRPVTTIIKRARNAYGFAAQIDSSTHIENYYDEALSPPAGH